MFIFPAIDIIDGKCVRLTKGDYSTGKVYSTDPLETAKIFEGAGLSHLHLVDLEGARERKPRNLDVLERIASKTSLTIDYGGGMYTTEALEAAFSAGASFVTCGSTAVRNRPLAIEWIERYKERIILGADCIDGCIATGAWAERSSLEAVPFISSYLDKGIRYCISTDVSRDGMMSGPGFSLYEKILSGVNVSLIASGGISSLSDLDRLREMGLYGAIVGKAYYEGRLSLKELREAEEC